MNLVATHYNCTSPMDYISHHALHSHVPIHHYTNHTAVTIHSLTLIVSPHLHLIHTHTYKQHTSLHSPRSLVLPRLTFWAFPLFSPGLPIYSDRLLPAFWPCLPLDILSVCHLPRPLHCPCCWFCLAFITPVTTFDHCLSDHLLSINKAAIGSNYTASSLQIWYCVKRISQVGEQMQNKSYNNNNNNMHLNNHTNVLLILLLIIIIILIIVK